MKKTVLSMARPTKLTPEIRKLIGENVALGLTYILAAESASVTYQTFNQWMSKGKTEKYGKYYQFYRYIQKRNVDAAKALLERLNDAAKAGNCQICIFILERRFKNEFGRRIYRNTNVVAENINQNVEIVVTDVDNIRKQIIDNIRIY